MKEKFSVEYSLNKVSATIAWNLIATPNGLSDWFADDVTASGKQYTFVWSKSPQSATLINQRQGAFVRFRWEEDEPNTKYFFEFHISKNELTGELIFRITDFAYADERQDSIELWNQQVTDLKHTLGV